ncbi:MAG: acyl-CoA dehydrogenase C-terminal domain-containing protein, partial [Pseudomonadota bacterium]
FDQAGAASHDYLHLFGLVAIGYMWLMMTKEAQDRAGDNDPFYENKLITARYFFERVLIESSVHLAKVKTGASSMMELDAEAF